MADPKAAFMASFGRKPVEASDPPKEANNERLTLAEDTVLLLAHLVGREQATAKLLPKSAAAADALRAEELLASFIRDAAKTRIAQMFGPAWSEDPVLRDRVDALIGQKLPKFTSAGGSS